MKKLSTKVVVQNTSECVVQEDPEFEKRERSTNSYTQTVVKKRIERKKKIHIQKTANALIVFIRN